MNFFEINGAEVNGDIEVHMPASTAKVSVSFSGLISPSRRIISDQSKVALSSSLSLTARVPLSGGAKISASSSLTIKRRAQIFSSANVNVKSDGEAKVSKPLEADFFVVVDGSLDITVSKSKIFNDSKAEVDSRSALSLIAKKYGSSKADAEVKSVSDVTRRAQLVSDAKVTLGMSLDGTVRSEIKGDAEFSFVASCDLTRRAMAYGYAQVVTLTSLTPKLSITVKARGEARVRSQAWGVASLKHNSISGLAEVEFNGSLQARLGGKLKLAGRTAITKAFASAVLNSRRYVRLEGENLELMFSAWENQSGKPQIPNEYLPAVPDRIFTLQNQDRTMYVTKRD